MPSFANRPSISWPQRRTPARRDAILGMALMEVLVSILIFAFGLLGLIGLEASAMHYSADAEDRNRAALFAGEIASSMWINNSVTPTTAQMTAWNTAIANTTTETGLPGGAVTVVPTPGGATNSADITISWVPTTDKANANLAATRYLTTRVILP